MFVVMEQMVTVMAVGMSCAFIIGDLNGRRHF
jgi:hypothetical protein